MPRNPIIPLAERFWPKVAIGAPDACWEWQARRSSLQYGIIWTSGSKRAGIPKRRLIASRVAWELTNGPIPDGLLVLHTCDNPPCCNPAHLWLGTQSDNMRDAWAKGRAFFQTHPEHHPRGARWQDAILSDDEVRAIRALYAAGGWTQKTLGLRFGCSGPQISQVLNRRARFARIK